MGRKGHDIIYGTRPAFCIREQQKTTELQPLHPIFEMSTFRIQARWRVQKIFQNFRRRLKNLGARMV